MAREKAPAGGMGPKGGPGHGPGGIGMPVQKAKNFKGTIKRLMIYLSPVKIGLTVVIFFAALSTIFNIIGPDKIGEATDEIGIGFAKMKFYDEVYKNLPEGAVLPEGTTGESILSQLPKEISDKLPEDYLDELKEMDMTTRPGIDFDAVRDILLYMLGLYVLSAVFFYIQGYIIAGVTQKVVLTMRRDVDLKLAKLPMRYFDAHTHGEILSRVTNDIDNISNTLQQSLSQIISSLITVVGVLIMMLRISPLLTLVTALTLPVSGFITMMIAKHSQKQFAANQLELGKINGHIEEIYTGQKVVKAFSHEKKAKEEFEVINERLYVAGFKSQFVSGIIMPLLNTISNFNYVLICVIGGVLSSGGHLSLGNISAFLTYSRNFNQPIIQLANMTNILQSTAASAERVFELLDETEEVADNAGAAAIENPRGDVSFEHISFGYDESRTLIHDMSIDVKQGQTIAIVGPTGAGKTTLVNLLMRFYEINSGAIRIDGVDITDIPRAKLRSMFGMVLQDTWLFGGTIRDNIAYGRGDATFDEILEASKAAYVDHFVRTLPEGYDTVLDEEASNISQGQRQLLTIARAVLADPSILILDEATSSVDTRTEVLIQKAMSKLMSGRTSFVIAHRLSTIRGADLILVMNHGDIIEQGTHEQLMEQNGFYAELYNSQFTKA